MILLVGPDGFSASRTSQARLEGRMVCGIGAVVKAEMRAAAIGRLADAAVGRGGCGLGTPLPARKLRQAPCLEHDAQAFQLRGR